MSESADKTTSNGMVGGYQLGQIVGHVGRATPLEMTPRGSIGGRTSRGKSSASVEELAAVRKAKQKVTARVGKAVDYYMDQARRRSVAVPWLYIYVAGSLGPASALYQIEIESEGSWHEHNDPWVYREPAFWYDRTGLNHDGWVQARQVLRELGLIEERRRYDRQRREIVTEVQWMPEAFCDACSAVRVDMRGDIRQAIEAGHDLGPGL